MRRLALLVVVLFPVVVCLADNADHRTVDFAPGIIVTIDGQKNVTWVVHIQRENLEDILATVIANDHPEVKAKAKKVLAEANEVSIVMTTDRTPFVKAK